MTDHRDAGTGRRSIDLGDGLSGGIGTVGHVAMETAVPPLAENPALPVSWPRASGIACRPGPAYRHR
jgi:hypothetical protein